MVISISFGFGQALKVVTRFQVPGKNEFKVQGRRHESLPREDRVH